VLKRSLGTWVFFVPLYDSGKSHVDRTVAWFDKFPVIKEKGPAWQVVHIQTVVWISVVSSG
jgi:hypothetical protein